MMNLIDDNKCLKEINKDNGPHGYLHRNWDSLDWRELELTADDVCENISQDYSDDGSSVFDEYDRVYTIPAKHGLHFYRINMRFQWEIVGAPSNSVSYCIRIDPDVYDKMYIIGNYNIQPGYKNPGAILKTETVSGTFVSIDYNYYFIVLY